MARNRENRRIFGQQIAQPVSQLVYVNRASTFVACLRLLQALYGIRRSSLLWLREFCHGLSQLGLQPVPGDECLFANSWLLVFFYVDDITTFYRWSDGTRFLAFRTALLTGYEMRDLGDLKWFLGIRILRDRALRKLWLCQDSYVSKIASSFHLDRLTQHPDAPMIIDDLQAHSEKATNQQIYSYQRKVSSLLYATRLPGQT